MLMIGCERTCQFFQSFRTLSAYQFKIFDDCDYLKICKIRSIAYKFKTFYDREFRKICKFHSEEEKRQFFVCFLGASVICDLMSLHIEISQSRISKYSFHKKLITGPQSQDSFLELDFL